MRPSLRLLGSAAGAIDRAVVAALRSRARRHPARPGHDERLRLLAEAYTAYAGAEEAFFPAPAPIDPALRDVRRGPPFGVIDVAWPSSTRPHLAAVADRYLAVTENRTARARLYLSGPSVGKRPVVVAIHGYLGGQWVLEEARWPLRWFIRLGLDVALPVLPFHGLRARPGPAMFPSVDARFTSEGFRQAATDLRELIGWLRACGAPSVGVMGISLGGYVAALLATLEPPPDFVVPLIPLASIADFAREQGALGTGDEAALLHEALERANAIASPLARPSRVDPRRALVVAGDNDRITGAAQAGRLATHLGCELFVTPGSHLVPLGRGDALRAVAAMLAREGFLPAGRS